MIKKLLFILLIITIFLSGCKKPDSTIKVIYPDEFNNGGVMINGQGYPCGYQDDICPNDYSPHKTVCEKLDPDC